MLTKDIDAVVAIEIESFSIPWSKDAFEDEMKNSKAYYVVMEEDNIIIGYGGFWKIFEEGHFTNLAITPAYRKKGLAKKLIEAMLNYCRTLDIQNATLEVRESNISALKAYSALGFCVEGKRRRYYTNPVEDALIMWLSL
jgi:ribosomal-protein-alanine N-acetyltransferase